MSVVDVVDVVSVGHGHVTAPGAMRVVVRLVLLVLSGIALVHVVLVVPMEVAVVDIVHVVPMGDGDMAAARSVDVLMPDVRAVLDSCRHSTQLRFLRCREKRRNSPAGCLRAADGVATCSTGRSALWVRGELLGRWVQPRSSAFLRWEDRSSRGRPQYGATEGLAEGLPRAALS
jgi:hypothetical protein